KVREIDRVVERILRNTVDVRNIGWKIRLEGAWTVDWRVGVWQWREIINITAQPRRQVEVVVRRDHTAFCISAGRILWDDVVVDGDRTHQDRVSRSGNHRPHHRHLIYH